MHSRRAEPAVQGGRSHAAATIQQVKRQFNRVVDWLIRALGSPSALAIAALAVIVWFVTGPIFGFSDTWQLVINTSTTIITFLMVFVIQNAANRDAKAVHIKLDELITSIEGARNKLVMAEHETEEEQDAEIQRLSEVAQDAERRGAPAAAIVEAVEQAAATGPESSHKRGAEESR
jgi:low affinity Fe/Cu permease